MAPRSNVVSLSGWSLAADDAHRATGLPLVQLWDDVERFVWARPGQSQGKTLHNRRRAKVVLTALLGPHPNPREVADALVQLDQSFKPGTVENFRKALAAVYAYGAKLGLCSGNPAAMVPHRRIEADPRPIINIEQVWPTLLDVCRDDRERAFLAVQRFALLRRGEALGLMLRDLVPGEPWRLNVVRQRPDSNRLDHTPPKSIHSHRELPVRAPLLALLRPVVEAGPVTVRCGLGGGERRVVDLLFPYRWQDLDDLMGRLRAVAPFAFPQGRKAWHALRDTGAVEMRWAGKTKSEITEMSGHSSEAVLSQHYLSSFGKAVPAAVIAGLDPPEGRAPRRRAAPGRSDALPAATGKASRRSKAVQPSEGEAPCSAKTKKVRSQRSLPGLSVGPVVTKPKVRR